VLTLRLTQTRPSSIPTIDINDRRFERYRRYDNHLNEL